MHTRYLNGAAAIGAATLITLSFGAFAQGGVSLPEGFDIIAQWNDNTWTLSNNPDDYEYVPNDDGGGFVFGESETSGWSAQWHVGDEGTGFETGSTSVFGNFSFTNTTGQTQTFTITVQSPLLQPLPGQTEISGSISGSVLDSGGDPGALVAAPSGGAIYNALVDGNAVQTLMDDPFSQTAPAGGTNTIGPQSFSGEQGPFGAFNTAAIQHTFTLSAGDSVTFSSSFHIIPAPGALAAFALAGVLGKRRRRD